MAWTGPRSRDVFAGRRNLWARAMAHSYAKNQLTPPSWDCTTCNNATTSMVNQWVFDKDTNPGGDTIVYDLAPGKQDNLVIQDMSKVTWTSNYLDVSSGARLLSRSNTDLVAQCQSTGEITVEAWVSPANITQEGPARIFAIADNDSSDTAEQNFMIGQGSWGSLDDAVFRGRVRTDTQNKSGSPPVKTPDATVTADTVQYVAITASATGSEMILTMYYNGLQSGNIETRYDIDTGSNFFDTVWDTSSPISVANAPFSARPWAGKLYQIRTYKRALNSDEIYGNYSVGSDSKSATPLPKVGFVSSTTSSNVLDGTAGVAVHMSGLRAVGIDVGVGVSSNNLTEGVDFTTDLVNNKTLVFTKDDYQKNITLTYLNGSSVESDILLTLSSISTGTIPGATSTHTETVLDGSTYPSDIGFSISSYILPPSYQASTLTLAVSSSRKYFKDIGVDLNLSANAGNTGSYALSADPVTLPASSLTVDFTISAMAGPAFYPEDDMIVSSVSSVAL
jgi:hypothetical protein